MSKRLRTFRIGGLKTTVRLEERIWQALNEIASRAGSSLDQTMVRIEEWRLRNEPGLSRSAAIRVYVLEHFRARLALSDKPVQ